MIIELLLTLVPDLAVRFKVVQVLRCLSEPGLEKSLVLSGCGGEGSLAAPAVRVDDIVRDGSFFQESSLSRNSCYGIGFLAVDFIEGKDSLHGFGKVDN